MKKKLMKSLALAAAGSLFLAGSAMALPSDYYTTTDLASSKTVTFNTDSPQYTNFGLYTVDDINAPTAIDSSFVVNFHAGPSGLFDEFIFTNLGGGSWGVDSDATGPGNDYTMAGRTFGMWFDYNGTMVYTDESLNTSADYIIDVKWTASNYSFYLTDQSGGALMAVNAVDVAPVPEPATMLLFGTGLAGLAGVSRRRKAKK